MLSMVNYLSILLASVIYIFVFKKFYRVAR